MAVTNREIAAGRMTHEDPLRRMAVGLAAAAALPSAAELLAQKEARKRADASIENLINKLKSAKTFDLPAARAKVGKVFDVAVTIDQRGRVLALFKAIMDEGERQLVRQGDQEELLAKFKEARVQDYNLLIRKECTVGTDLPGGGHVSVDMLMAVTNREIAAGRMTEDHSQRKIAVEGAAAPHFSHAEMLVQYAKLKDKSGKAKALHASKTVGEKLKGLFRRN